MTRTSTFKSPFLSIFRKHTGYRDFTRRVADYFVGDQQPDGHWQDSGPYGHAPHVNIMVTAEFVMILDTMIACLSV